MHEHYISAYGQVSRRRLIRVLSQEHSVVNFFFKLE